MIHFDATLEARGTQMLRIRKSGEMPCGAASCDRFAVHFVRATFRFAAAHSDAVLWNFRHLCAATPQRHFAKVTPFGSHVKVVSRQAANDANLGKNPMWRRSRRERLTNSKRDRRSHSGSCPILRIAQSDLRSKTAGRSVLNQLLIFSDYDI